MLFLLLIGVAAAGSPSKVGDEAKWSEKLWKAHCRQCHGDRGQGDGAALAQLTAEVPALAGRVDDTDRWVHVVQAGAGMMPAFNDVLNPSDTRRVLRWMGSIDPETGKTDKEVEEARKAEAKAEAKAKAKASEDADEPTTAEDDEAPAAPPAPPKVPSPPVSSKPAPTPATAPPTP